MSHWSLCCELTLCPEYERRLDANLTRQTSCKEAERTFLSIKASHIVLVFQVTCQMLVDWFIAEIERRDSVSPKVKLFVCMNVY